MPIDLIHAPSAKKPKRNASLEEWEYYRQEQKQTRIGIHAQASLKNLSEQVPDKDIICAADGGYTNKTVFRHLPENVTMIGRIRKDARLYAAPDKLGTGKGRKRYYGDLLPTPEEIRQDGSILWQQVEAYAAGKRHIFDIKTMSGVRWTGTGDKDVRIVIIRPLAYRLSKGSRLLYKSPAYLLCTDPELSLESLIQAYVWRWEIELNFRDEKTVLGVGQAQVRNRLAAEGVPALVVASYAYLLLAADKISMKTSSLPRTSWYPAKPGQRASTQQMISLFRTQLWGIGINGNKTGFVCSTPTDTNRFNYKHSLQATITHARK